MKKRMNMAVRFISLVVLAAMIFCTAGCSKDGPKSTSPEVKPNKNADGTYFDNGETFCRGVWAVDDGEKRVGYYIFYDAEKGNFHDAQLGMEVPFAVRINQNAVDFSLGGADFTDPTTVEKIGEGKRTLTWTNENRTENLMLLGEQEPDSFSCYSQNDLIEMAMDYYELENGRRPETSVVTMGIDGIASIQLLNRVGKNGRVIAEYEVDSITGKGTVKGTDEEIQLKRMTTDD